MFDNCEASLSSYIIDPESEEKIHVCKNHTSSTSFYLGHYINCCEGGMIFTNDRKEYAYFLLNRNHGMIRSLRDEMWIGSHDYIDRRNILVDERFDFCSLGNNFRSTDIAAKIGLLDFKRKYYYINRRQSLYYNFAVSLDSKKYLLPKEYLDRKYVPFCLPIITQGCGKQNRIFAVKEYLEEHSIESRPIISGFLGFHTPYKKYMSGKDHPNAVHLHKYGVYVGLYAGIKEKQIIKLVKDLNKL